MSRKKEQAPRADDADLDGLKLDLALARIEAKLEVFAQMEETMDKLSKTVKQCIDDLRAEPYAPSPVETQGLRKRTNANNYTI